MYYALQYLSFILLRRTLFNIWQTAKGTLTDFVNYLPLIENIFMQMKMKTSGIKRHTLFK